MREITAIVIHHSASPPWTKAWEIKRWHRQRGFNDIGYHLVIHDGGEVVPGRHPELEGAHVLGHNEYTLGICIVGDNSAPQGGQLNELGWRPKQIVAAQALLRALRALTPGLDVIAHYELADTICPGKDAFERLMEEM